MLPWSSVCMVTLSADGPDSSCMLAWLEIARKNIAHFQFVNDITVFLMLQEVSPHGAMVSWYFSDSAVMSFDHLSDTAEVAETATETCCVLDGSGRISIKTGTAHPNPHLRNVVPPVGGRREVREGQIGRQRVFELF